MKQIHDFPANHAIDKWQPRIEVIVKNYLIGIRNLDAATPPIWPWNFPLTYLRLPHGRILAIVDRDALFVAADFSNEGFTIMPAHRRMANQAYRSLLAEMIEVGAKVDDAKPCDHHGRLLRYGDLESSELDLSRFDAGIFFNPWWFSSVIALVIEKNQVERAYELINCVFEFADYKEQQIEHWKVIAFAGDELSLLIGKEGAGVFRSAEYVLGSRINLSRWKRRATRSVACLQDAPSLVYEWRKDGLFERLLKDDSLDAEIKFRKEAIAQVDQINNWLSDVLCAPKFDDGAVLNPVTGEWERG